MWTLRAGRQRFSSLAHFFLFLLLTGALLIPRSGYGQGPSDTTPNPNATFEELSAQAASLREAGNVNAAIRHYESALKIHPDWAEGWWYVGTMYYDADHYVEAISALQNLIALNPDLGPALAFLGLSEFETKDYENSLIHLQKAEQQGYADDAELANVAKYHLAMLLNRNGEFEKTNGVLRSAYSQKRPPDQIKAVLGLALLRVPLFPSEVDSGKDALIHGAGEAAALELGGDSEKAAEVLRTLLADHPQTPYLHYALAMILERTNKPDDALAQLAEEIKISPESALPYVRTASIQLQVHRTKEALASAQKAVQIAPRSAAAHEVLARILKSLGKTVDATKESAAMAKLQSAGIEVDLRQQRLYARSVAGESAASTQGAVAGSVASQPSSETFEVLAQKAASARTAGQLEAAASYCQRALTLRPGWGEGWQNLGTLHYASGHFAEAVTALKNAAAIEASNGNVWALLGLSEFETRDYENALIHLQRGRDLGFSGNPSAVQIAKYHLALLLNRKGEFDRVTELLTPESGAGPAKEEVRFALGIALLRIARFPEEIDSSKEALVREAGETAALLVESKYDQAFSRFQQLVKEYPDTPYLHYAYGTALTSASQYDEAEQQLSEEARITPKSALPYRRRAAIALQLRKPEKALQLAQQAVQLDAESGEGHYLVGRAWLELGKTEDSIKELETARQLVPNSPEVHFNLARAYAKAGRSDEATQERGVFERLNASVQRQRSMQGSQAYGALQNQNGIQAAQGQDPAQASSEPK